MNLKFGEYLKNMGLKLLLPETYTFCEQMALFNNADYIVGGSGACIYKFIVLS